MEPVLSTREVTKLYELDDQIITAVDRVSLDLYAGEFVALVGPSGSGKTTMLAMIAGLLSPTSGEIWLGGEEFGQMKEKERTRIRREKIGFTFQANNLVNYLNALENVELMLRLNSRYDKAGAERSAALLDRLGLGDRLLNMPAQLSGGQRQRVAIARSVIHEPQLVLADEPTASLDTVLAFQVVETFSNLIHEQKRTGIMVTHDLRMVRYCDRVIEMEDGRLKGIISDRAEIEALAGLDPAAVVHQNGHLKEPIPTAFA
jgi:putative ABC transport system ATP-binding protein